MQPQSQQPRTHIQMNLHQSHHGGHQKLIDKNFGNRSRPQNFSNQEQRLSKDILLQMNEFAQQPNNVIDTKLKPLLRNNAQFSQQDFQSYNDVFSETSSLKSDRESTGSITSSSLQTAAGKTRNASQVRNNAYNDAQNTHMIHNAKSIGKVSRNTAVREAHDPRNVSEIIAPHGGNHGHLMTQPLQPEVFAHVDMNRQLHHQVSRINIFITITGHSFS